MPVKTTAKGVGWFLHNIKQTGLPTGCRIIVGGRGTERYSELFKDIPGLEFRGWISNEELTDLLSRVKAFLAPQLSGFGALTKISELTCAGSPCWYPSMLPNQSTRRLE